MADLLESLKAQPGLYVGRQRTLLDEQDALGTCRLLVTVLPGGSGVALDYEVLSPAGALAHAEHAVLAATAGARVLVTAHSHAGVATVLTESATDPGYFTVADDQAPFPSAIRLEVPEPGHLVYSWSYGWGDQPLQVRDIGDLRHTPLVLF